MLFAPTDLDVAITPQSITQAIHRNEYALAINMSLHLHEKQLIKQAIDSISMNAIELVVKSIDVRMIKELLKFIAEQIVSFIIIIIKYDIHLYNLNYIFITIFSIYIYKNSMFTFKYNYICLLLTRYHPGIQSTICIGVGICYILTIKLCLQL